MPTLPVVALFVYWAAHQGGYLPTTWGLSALLVLGLLVATVVGLGFARIRLSRPAAVALAALTAYTAWSYLSIAWAASPGDALSGSNRTLLFLLLFALFALLPWRPWTALVALSAFAIGIGVVAVVTLARLTSATEVPGMFTDGRLTAPLAYVNGSAALFLTVALVAIALAARRELPWLLRGPLLALATAALQASVLCESRGWLFALPVVTVVALALIPQRVRFALWALPPLAGGLLALPALLDVFSRTDAAESPVAARAELADAAAHAAGIALPICAGVLVLGTLLALLDSRVSVPARVSTGANRVAAGLAVAGVLAAAAIGLVATDGRPDQRIADYWDRSGSYQSTDPGASRFGAVGSNRPDFWRVSLKAFRDNPIGGLGQDNWARFYLLDRRSHEQPRWTHSLELRLLAHTGAIGFLLFAGFLAATLVAALRNRRRSAALTSATAAVALLPLVVWTVHGSIDWFWEIPALSGPTFAFAGLATALMRPLSERTVAAGAAGATAAPGNGDPPEPRPAPAGPRWGLPAGIALSATALVAAVALALPYVAEREANAAASDWQQDPTAALAQLDRAARLNPLSARPDLLAGVIALELGQPALARDRFDRALDRDPDDWFAHFGRGLAASALDEPAAARADYRRAHELSPDEPLVDDALRAVDGPKPLTAEQAFAHLRRNVKALTGTP